MSKNPTPLTVDPIYFYINFFAGIVFSGSLYPVAKIIENSNFWAYAILKVPPKVEAKLCDCC